MIETPNPQHPETQQDRQRYLLLSEDNKDILQQGDQLRENGRWTVIKPCCVGDRVLIEGIFRRPLKEPAPQQWISVKGDHPISILSSRPVVIRKQEALGSRSYELVFPGQVVPEQATHYFLLPPLPIQEEKKPREWWGTARTSDGGLCCVSKNKELAIASNQSVHQEDSSVILVREVLEEESP